MSGIAEVLVNQGFKVSGSDIKYNDNCRRLESLGVRIEIGQRAENIPEDVSLLVYSSAVTESNPEIVAAKERGLPVIRRAEVLAELIRLKFGIVVAGSHGKTSTTSMISAVLEHAQLDPTTIVGGQITGKGYAGRLGKGQFLVAESDESDRSFLLLTPSIAIVTNIDSEHLSAYSSMQELEESFGRFVESVPFYGLSIFCVDDARVKGLYQSYTKRKVSYGFSPEAEFSLSNLSFDREVTDFDVLRDGEKIAHISLPMCGSHMALNSLNAVIVGLELGISINTIVEALNGFKGVQRRSEILGQTKGVTVINDYGHHPTEVKATLRAIRQGWAKELRENGARLWVIFQPHRYSRTRDSFADYLTAFNDADNLILTDIYAASEEPIEGISGSILFNAISHGNKAFVSAPEDALAMLKNALKPGDVVVTMGAGSVGLLGNKILKA